MKGVGLIILVFITSVCFGQEVLVDYTVTTNAITYNAISNTFTIPANKYLGNVIEATI